MDNFTAEDFRSWAIVQDDDHEEYLLLADDEADYIYFDYDNGQVYTMAEMTADYLASERGQVDGSFEDFANYLNGSMIMGCLAIIAKADIDEFRQELERMA